MSTPFESTAINALPGLEKPFGGDARTTLDQLRSRMTTVPMDAGLLGNYAKPVEFLITKVNEVEGLEPVHDGLIQITNEEGVLCMLIGVYRKEMEGQNLYVPVTIQNTSGSNVRRPEIEAQNLAIVSTIADAEFRDSSDGGSQLYNGLIDFLKDGSALPGDLKDRIGPLNIAGEEFKPAYGMDSLRTGKHWHGAISSHTVSFIGETPFPDIIMRTIDLSLFLKGYKNISEHLSSMVRLLNTPPEKRKKFLGIKKR